MNHLISPRIFISYSHRGNGPKWKAALLNALHVFERQHLLDVWQDDKIRNSSYWEDDINQAMASAQLAVILLTPEALESQFILEKELPTLGKRRQEDKLPVFPVICESCHWEGIDWLKAAQVPNASNPLSQLSDAAQDQVFRKLATDIAEELSRNVLSEFSKPEQEIIPANVYLDKFPLTKSGGKPEKLIGREQELALLDLAFAQPHTAIVSLVAWGGVGKTMLVQHWLQRLQHEDWFGVRRVYAWSFYSQGTKEDRQVSEDMFLAHALEWFGVQCEPTLSPWDKGRLLAEAVVREQTLLILDGIEPLQYPPGPMGGQLRAPGVQSLLKQLARKANNSGLHSLCLVTTRELLTDLADFERRPDAAWGSVLRVDLGNLTEEAGAALLHHAGAKRAGAAEIKADDKELVAASREVDGHALTLNLLGRFLARTRNGDIRQRDLVNFEEADRNVQGSTTFKMIAAFESWFDNEGDIEARSLAILRMLGLFDRPADAGCMAALRKSPIIAGLTEPFFVHKHDSSTGQIAEYPLSDKAWNDAVHFLTDFGLLEIQANDDNGESLLDCHPLIREHFAKHIRKKSPKTWNSAHSRLYEHLKDSTEFQPSTLDGLQPLYQAITHGCTAGYHQLVCEDIYMARILRGTGTRGFFSTNRLGAFGADLSALACFFSLPWITFPDSLDGDHRAWLLNAAAFCLRGNGRMTEALEPTKASLKMRVRQKNWKTAANCSGNLAELLSTLGRIREASTAAKAAADYAMQSKDEDERLIRLTDLGDIQHQAGNLAFAAELFSLAEEILMRQCPTCPHLYALGGFQLCDLLLSVVERQVWVSILDPNTIKSYQESNLMRLCTGASRRATDTLSWISQFNAVSLLSVALDYLTLCRAELFRCILESNPFYVSDKNIHQHLIAALDGLRRFGVGDFIVRGLLTSALLSFLEGDPAGAQADLDEAWDIAERGPMRLHMADIHLYRSRLFFREKHYPWKSPQDDLAAAEKLINECGYHRRDEELADAKRAILG